MFEWIWDGGARRNQKTYKDEHKEHPKITELSWRVVYKFAQ